MTRPGGVLAGFEHWSDFMLNVVKPDLHRRRARSTFIFVQPFLALSGLILACGVPGQVRAEEARLIVAAAEPGVVKIDNFTFSPATVTVAPGTTVTWINDDDIPHTVMAKDKTFRSKPLDTGNEFSFTFGTPGEYAYFCSLHPHMIAKVIVKPTDAAGASH